MDYIYSVIILISLFVVLATSFNLVIGYGGLISIAHPIFYGLGAYTSALLARDAGLPVPLAMLAGAALATAMSVVVSLPALRISGDYLLIASIGFQLGMIELIKNLRFTGGASGVSNIPAFLVPSYGRISYVVLVICVAVAVVLLVRWIAHSDYGRAISAMRDDAGVVGDAHHDDLVDRGGRVEALEHDDVARVDRGRHARRHHGRERRPRLQVAERGRDGQQQRRDEDPAAAAGPGLRALHAGAKRAGPARRRGGGSAA